MKKKLIFMLINMNVGGTEKALINMISEMSTEEYDITLLMLEEYGGFLNSIPKDIHVEYLTGYNKIKGILNQPPHITALTFLSRGKLGKAINIMLLHLVSKITRERSIVFKYALRGFKNIEELYDVAIAYAGPMDFISYFVINKIKAKKKIQWVHFDISKIGFNKNFASKIYSRFDQIFVVSNEGKNKLTNILPKLKEKTDTFTNILSSKLIIKMAEEDNGFEDKFDGFRILTVGRLSKEKGQDLTIPVLAKLKDNGFNVKWYCIGDGSARNEYEDLIKEYKLENDYILLGAYVNPYPFMKQCDLYVQSSRHEGYCITLSEAKCFGNPIISTNFTGAKEQIINGKTGLLVDFNEEQMYNALIKLLEDETLRDNFKENLHHLIPDTTNEVRKFNLI